MKIMQLLFQALFSKSKPISNHEKHHIKNQAFPRISSTRVGLPGGPGLLCKMTTPSGSGHYSALSPCCTTYWSPAMRRRLLGWMCRTTSSWADKKEVCETWSPSRIACSDTRRRNPKILLHCTDRCAGRKQEERTF